MPLRCLLALVGGLALAAAFEPIGHAWLMPPAVAALVISVHGLAPLRAWVPSLVFGIAFIFSVMVWMRAVGTDAWIAMCTLESAFFVPLGIGLSWSMRVRAWPVLAALWWVGVETWRSGFPFSGMPFGRLVFATADTPWADAIAWVGMTGVSFLVALTGTTLAWLLVQLSARSRGQAPASTRTTYAVVAALAVVTLAPTLAPYPLERTGSATVALVQGDVPGTGLNVPAVHREVTANHVRLTRELAAAVDAGEQQQPDFVVWPENSTAVDPFLDPGVRAGIVAASDAIEVPIIVGGTNSNPLDDTQVLNQGIVYQPGLGSGDRYTKRNPVPYGEYIPFRGSSWMPSTYGRLTEVPRDMVRGTSLEPIRVGEHLVADAICFDVAYDDGIAGQVARGAELVTVQTSNAMFSRTGQLAQQFEISRLRAVETGRWVVVAAINGVSGVVRPDGSVVASAPARTHEVLVETVGLSTTTTLAVRLGVWPGRLVLLFLVLHAAAVAVAYRRARPGVRPSDRESEQGGTE
ncbi:apolipoprotein N-acyltransferase [Nocardioides flavus (ex Wang et al. 2016)]|uniref:Apolipoprotein N-acyltransferase n=1 Tax=Nocardioides flavus (ex Wang et al. 2016) TaxID=2058780 RepID=A0ABQ3HLJ3_9ACTN|nr:apolipoprotein N-acyltransferase [Nocardioides flavus (ex Wang et al. 2016)]GHE18096.1 apolipoprotein N-acyltransferase [Nocardioides flavus (ex Wang et al. 2016)]